MNQLQNQMIKNLDIFDYFPYDIWSIIINMAEYDFNILRWKLFDPEESKEDMNTTIKIMKMILHSKDFNKKINKKNNEYELDCIRHLIPLFINNNGYLGIKLLNEIKLFDKISYDFCSLVKKGNYYLVNYMLTKINNHGTLLDFNFSDNLRYFLEPTEPNYDNNPTYEKRKIQIKSILKTLLSNKLIITLFYRQCIENKKLSVSDFDIDWMLLKDKKNWDKNPKLLKIYEKEIKLCLRNETIYHKLINNISLFFRLGISFSNFLKIEKRKKFIVKNNKERNLIIEYMIMRAHQLSFSKEEMNQMIIDYLEADLMEMIFNEYHFFN